MDMVDGAEPLTLERYDKDSVRLVTGGRVVGMLLRHCDDLWSINDLREQRLTKKRFRRTKDALVFAQDHLSDALTSRA